jgi:hypothetical protein
MLFRRGRESDEGFMWDKMMLITQLNFVKDPMDHITSLADFVVEGGKTREAPSKRSSAKGKL